MSKLEERKEDTNIETITLEKPINSFAFTRNIRPFVKKNPYERIAVITQHPVIKLSELQKKPYEKFFEYNPIKYLFKVSDGKSERAFETIIEHKNGFFVNDIFMQNADGRKTWKIKDDNKHKFKAAEKIQKGFVCRVIDGKKGILEITKCAFTQPAYVEEGSAVAKLGKKGTCKIQVDPNRMHVRQDEDFPLFNKGYFFEKQTQIIENYVAFKIVESESEFQMGLRDNTRTALFDLHQKLSDPTALLNLPKQLWKPVEMVTGLGFDVSTGIGVIAVNVPFKSAKSYWREFPFESNILRSAKWQIYDRDGKSQNRGNDSQYKTQYFESFIILEMPLRLQSLVSTIKIGEKLLHVTLPNSKQYSLLLSPYLVTFVDEIIKEQQEIFKEKEEKIETEKELEKQKEPTVLLDFSAVPTIPIPEKPQSLGNIVLKDKLHQLKQKTSRIEEKLKLIKYCVSEIEKEVADTKEHITFIESSFNYSQNTIQVNDISLAGEWWDNFEKDFS